MHTSNRAVRSACFLRKVFSFDVCFGVGRQRYSGIAALLRAVMYESVFADVQVTAARSASPLIGFAVGQVFLERVPSYVTFLSKVFHFEIEVAFDSSQWFERA